MRGWEKAAAAAFFSLFFPPSPDLRAACAPRAGRRLPQDS